MHWFVEAIFGGVSEEKEKITRTQRSACSENPYAFLHSLSLSFSCSLFLGYFNEICICAVLSSNFSLESSS
jgi:hypothetical protein